MNLETAEKILTDHHEMGAPEVQTGVCVGDHTYSAESWPCEIHDLAAAFIELWHEAVRRGR